MRRASFSEEMVLNDDMLRPPIGMGAILQLSPHGEIASPCGNHNLDRGLPVNGFVPIHLVVFMAMVDVRVVRMPVPKRFMPVPVRMRLCHRSFVSVAMMRIVAMAVLVLDCLVRVFMGMPFGQMQPDAERHQQARDDQLRSDRLAQEANRDDRAKERREREISPSPRAAEMAQRQDKQHEA
jgi:hypothetical protein